MLTLLLLGGAGCVARMPPLPTAVVAPATAPVPQGPRLPVLEPAAALRQLTDPQAVVLDVRTPQEYTAGHLGRAQNIDFRSPDFSEQVSRLNPTARYVLYCASGNRSSQAAAVMKNLGFTNMVNAGGYENLKAAGAK